MTEFPWWAWLQGLGVPTVAIYEGWMAAYRSRRYRLALSCENNTGFVADSCYLNKSLFSVSLVSWCYLSTYKCSQANQDKMARGNWTGCRLKTTATQQNSSACPKDTVLAPEFHHHSLNQISGYQGPAKFQYGRRKDYITWL